MSVVSAVPDVLGPGLRVVFCGINPGRVSAAAGAPFANPRNDFWRLLHAAEFTPRLLQPAEAGELPRYGLGLTNAARRTTKGSGDLRKADFERSNRAACGDRSFAATPLDRVRGEDRLHRSFRRAGRARASGGAPRRDRAFRASFDVPRERRGALGREAAVVPGAARARRVNEPRLRRPHARSTRESLVPESVDPGAEHDDPFALDRIEMSRPLPAMCDEAGVLEHPKVLRHRGPAHGELSCELADRSRPAAKELEHLPPRRIAESVHRVTVSYHLP